MPDARLCAHPFYFFIVPGLFFYGAGGENRTRTGLGPEDFESSASTSFTTPAGFLSICKIRMLVNRFENIIRAIACK